MIAATARPQFAYEWQVVQMTRASRRCNDFACLRFAAQRLSLSIVMITSLAPTTVSANPRAKSRVATPEVQTAEKLSEAQVEAILLENRYASADLRFDPPRDVRVLVTSTRYEEDRKSFLARVTTGQACETQEDCPAHYRCSAVPETQRVETKKRCIVTDGTGDNRVERETKVGEYRVVRNVRTGKTACSFRFLSEPKWLRLHARDRIAHNAELRLDVDPFPPPTIPAPAYSGPATWQTVAFEPMLLRKLPLLEKIQKRQKLGRQRSRQTVAISTWIYRVELSALGHATRKLLFYNDEAPPDVDVGRLQEAGWTAKIFKRIPSGDYLIDEEFTLTPQPRVLSRRYLQYLQLSKCQRESEDWAHRTLASKNDADDLLWEQLMFTNEKRKIALKLEDDAEFRAWRDTMMNNFRCPPEPEQ